MNKAQADRTEEVKHNDDSDNKQESNKGGSQQNLSYFKHV